jgi:putative transposase
MIHNTTFMSTYSKIYLHIVFGVKRRRPLIHTSWEDRLYAYITGIVQQKGQMLLAINGMPDHIHLLIAIKPGCCISDLVREIKKSSNEYIRENRLCPSVFSWQEGFGVFSYSRTESDRVINYIRKQKEHHRKKSFREEYEKMLIEAGVDYKPEYLFGNE